MTIQVGVPGAAGGGGGGAAVSIAQGGGSVTVNPDGSITIKPVDGQNIIRVRGTAQGNAPLFEFDDDVGSPNGYVGAEGPNAGDHLDDASQNAMILAGSSVFIGIIGNVSSFDITGSGVEVKAPRWIVTTPGPHAWGQAFVGNDRQFEFAGPYTGGGFSEALRKFLIQGNLTGFLGDTDGLFGLEVVPSFITQSETEDIDLIANIRIPISPITDNLTGAILETAGLFIEGPMVGGNANYAILAEVGLSKLGSIWAREVGPHVFGGSFISQTAQFDFSGPFVTAGSDSAKFRLGNSLTGGSGTQRYRGMQLGVSFITQAEDETVLSMATLEISPPSITDNLTGAGSITQAATVRITSAPTAGDENFALVVEGGLSKFINILSAGVGPYAFGVTSFNPSHQFEFGGNILRSGSSIKKFLFEGGLTADDGVAEMFGMRVRPSFITQTEVADIDCIAGLFVGSPGIVDNLTGNIVEAVTLDVENAPTAGVTNFAFRVRSGLSRLQNLEHAGTLLGFYSTAGVAQPTGVAVTDAAIHAALVTLGLITA